MGVPPDFGRWGHSPTGRGDPHRTKSGERSRRRLGRPDTRVVHTTDVTGRSGTYTLHVPVGAAEEPFYPRLRGSDGRSNGRGLLGAAIDPHGPVAHRPGDGDPWADTWCYTNPIFVDVR